MKNLLGVGGLALALVCTALTGQSGAAIIVTPGVNNQNTANVIANASCGPLITSGLIVTGCLNTSHDSRIQFEGVEALEYSGGQAFLVADDGAFDYLKISVLTPASVTFGKLLVNIDAAEAGFVTFTGSPGGSSGQIALAKGGENKSSSSPVKISLG